MKFGQFFQKKLGIDPSTLQSIHEIDKVVGSHIGHPVRLGSYRSNLLSAGGNVFPVTGDYDDLDAEIDRELENMQRCHG